MIKKLVLYIIGIGISITGASQERIGISSDPSSGVYGLFLNPAFSSRYSMDYHINLFSFHLFAETDYGKVTNANLFSLLSNIDNIDVISRRDQINENNSNKQLIFDTDGGRKSVAVSTSILWPSAIWKKSEKERIGFFLHTRGMFSSYRIPEQLGYYEAAEVRDSLVTIGKFGAVAGSWTDLGLHYSKMLDKDSYESSAIGINAKLVLPHESGKFKSTREVEYSRLRDTFSAEGLVTESGYNFFQSGSTSYSPRFNGIGLSADIGYHYSNTDYSYGVSLLDFGFMAISGNAETYNIISDTTIYFDGSTIIDPNDITEIINEVDDQLEPQVSRVVEQGGSFMLGQPTAISIQYARPFSKNIFISANLIQRFPIFKNSIRRVNSLSVVPTYQSGLWHVATPVTLQNYEKVRVGAAIKYWFFYMGSDNITSLFGSSDFTGTDIYFGFQWYPFDQAVKKKGVKCFDFKE